MSQRLRSSGFTLIELMIVLLIAGLLAVLTVTAISGYMRRGTNLNAIADVQAIVRFVPMQAKKNLCASHLLIDAKSQKLEAWVCGARQKQLELGNPYSFRFTDFGLKKDEPTADVSIIWYTPRAGGASARLDVYEGESRIQSIDLSMFTSYHAAK